MWILAALLGTLGIPIWLATGPIETGEARLEYMHPTKEDRQIRTITLDLTSGRSLLSGHMELASGISLTRPSGSIRQLEGDLALGTLSSVTFSSDAYGVGPVFVVRFLPFPSWLLSPGIDVSGGILFYSPRFPAGGDIYNGMGRVGPSLRLRLANGLALQVRGQWMHVSNGQGVVRHNPSYEAIGVSAGLHWKW